MTTSLKDLRERRGRLVADMRGLLDAASAETRDLTTEEQSRYDEMFAEQERFGGQIAREERQQDLDRRMAETAAHGSNGDGRQSAAETRDAPREDRANPRATPEYRAAFARFLRGGVGVLAGEELRALQAGADVDGNYLVAPQQFVTELIKAVDDQVAIRGLARTFQVPQAASMGAPSLDADPAEADWTTELQTGAEDTAMRLRQARAAAAPAGQAHQGQPAAAAPGPDRAGRAGAYVFVAVEFGSRRHSCRAFGRSLRGAGAGAPGGASVLRIHRTWCGAWIDAASRSWLY